MADTELPAEVSRLIDRVIGSMDHVEVVRHLYLAPGDAVTADDLAARTHIDRGTVARILGDLDTAGIVREAAGAYRYAAGARDQDAIASLVDMYNTRPVTLVRAVYARPAPLKSFANAFRIRRDD